MRFNREIFQFKTKELEGLAKVHRDSYAKAQPYPHVVLDDFLPEKHAKYVLKDFPDTKSNIWLDWKKRDTRHQPQKQGVGHASRLDGVSPYLLSILSAFNSYPFLNFLEALTGIKKLLPDPYFHGGGLHQIMSGGRLAVHADFNDLKLLDLYRRINVLFYINKSWKKEYNGNIELWDKELKNCVKSIAPTFNRLVIFNTNKTSFHGHPKPLNTPPNITRKSLAFYYYTSRPSSGEIYNQKTDWQDTPSR